jgi:hypothetical protein
MIATLKKITLPLGRVVATPEALASIEQSGQSPSEFLDRHIKGDWGEVCGDDWATNDQALVDGDRILSAYTTKGGTKVWVITEWDRSSTCVLLPGEY